MIRAFARFLLLAAILTVVVGATSGKPDEIQCEWSGVECVVAIGDIHGDYDQLVKCLEIAEVIDTNGVWTAGKAHLVQTGDILDRGTNSCKALDLLMGLEPQAEKAGGKVHVLIGNHEAMILAGYYHYMNSEDMKAFGGEAGLKRLMAPEGRYGKWLRDKNVAIKINDSLFVHAGITKKDVSKSLREINDGIRRNLSAPAPHREPPIQEIFWTRLFSMGEERQAAEEVQLALDAYGAKRMVIGHTVTLSGIKTRANGKIVMIDVGLSSVYGGKAECLVIQEGKVCAVSESGKRKL